MSHYETPTLKRPAILDAPNQVLGPRCTCCGTPANQSIQGFGYENAKVMEIGIAPGRHEMRWGIPLVGPSGERNDRCLRAVKYPRARVYASNLICWWKDEPTRDEIEACWPRLREEILDVRPKLIISLGGLATEWLTGYTVGKTRGNLIRPEYNRSEHFAELLDRWGSHSLDDHRDSRSHLHASEGSLGSGSGDPHLPTILPTWHPAASLRVASLATDILRDYRKIKRFLRGELEPLQWGYRVVRGPKTAQRILDSLSGSGRYVSLDVETERDEADSFQQIICVALATKIESDEDRAALCPWLPEGKEYVSWVFPAETLDGLRWPKKVRWLEHNMQFDNPQIKRRFGVWLPRVRDTMLWSWGCDERPGRDEDSASDRTRSGEKSKPKGPGYHGLKQLSAEYNGAPPGYGDEIKRNFNMTLDEIATPRPIPLTEAETELVYAAASPQRGAKSGDTESTLELAPGSIAAPTKRKSKAPTRMETPEEAADRFARFLKDLYEYNAFDAINTVALPERLPKNPCPALETVIFPAAQTYARIHLQGIPINRDRVIELQEDWEPWINDLKGDLQEDAASYGYRNPPKLKRDIKAKEEYEAEHGEGSWRGEPINLGSFLQLGRLLYGILKVPVKVRTATGRPSTGKEAIEQINHPFVARLTELRTAEHVKASHLDPVLELLKGDGRIHPNIWTNGAVNYRRSITNPPMQQYPQEHPQPFWKRLAEIRSIVRPEKGFGLLESDYKQIELWGAALLSGDPVFLEDMHSGDYHTRQVRETFRVVAPEDTVIFSHTRRIAKVFNFAVIYRVEENTLAKIMNEGASFGDTKTKKVTPQEAARLIRKWYARNRVFWLWQEEMIRQVRKTGRLENPFGAVRRFPLYDKMLDKQIVNWPVSSTCGMHSEISCIKLEPIIRKEFGGQILFDTHDSLLFHIPLKRMDAAARVIREVMEEPKIPGWPPLKIEFKMSDVNWREMHPWEEQSEKRTGTPRTKEDRQNGARRLDRGKSGQGANSIFQRHAPALV